MMPVEERWRRMNAAYLTFKEILDGGEVDALEKILYGCQANDTILTELMEELHSWQRECSRMRLRSGEYYLVPVERVALIVGERDESQS